MSKRKKFVCSECGQRKEIKYLRQSSALPGKSYCSLECYVSALRKQWPVERQESTLKPK